MIGIFNIVTIVDCFKSTRKYVMYAFRSSPTHVHSQLLWTGGVIFISDMFCKTARHYEECASDGGFFFLAFHQWIWIRRISVGNGKLNQEMFS